MKKEKLLNQTLINSNNEMFVIVDVNESENLKDITILLDNKKMYNLYLCYKSGYMKFKDNDLNE